MPASLKVANPAWATVTSYCPGIKPTCENRPMALEAPSDTAPVAVFVMLTLAATIAAPDGSETEPLIIPVVAICAWDAGQVRTSHRTMPSPAFEGHWEVCDSTWRIPYTPLWSFNIGVETP